MLVNAPIDTRAKKEKTFLVGLEVGLGQRGVSLSRSHLNSLTSTLYLAGTLGSTSSRKACGSH